MIHPCPLFHKNAAIIDSMSGVSMDLVRVLKDNQIEINKLKQHAQAYYNHKMHKKQDNMAAYYAKKIEKINYKCISSNVRKFIESEDDDNDECV